jgi:hypothetical protein
MLKLMRRNEILGYVTTSYLSMINNLEVDEHLGNNDYCIIV